ncbi:MAG: hypothetical protein DCC73_08825 [Proteobacteria bacterium]|nr:MAG: hypothetical protein DCC73_08825 [Pseudomonadota bacterium]
MAVTSAIIGRLKMAALILLMGLIGLPSPSLSAGARDGRQLVVAMASLQNETFLPWNGGGNRKFYLDTIYEYLVYLDPVTDALVPGLAERWEMSADGRSYTFWIRPGIAFHEGWGEVTAADVKYSVERMIGPRSIAGPSSSLRKLIRDVTTPSPNLVTITLNTPDIEFIRGYIVNANQLSIVSKTYIETVGDQKANAHPIGTGPFTLAERKRGLNITLRVADAAKPHWRIGRPAMDAIVFKSAPEEATRIAMLYTGEADLAPVNYDSLSAVKRAGLSIHLFKDSWSPVVRLGGLVETLPGFYNPKVPWAKKKVRQALNYAIDKEAILKHIFHGLGRVASSDFPADEWRDVATYPYDPDQARRLLAEAGYPDGFDITLKTFTTVPGAELPIVAEAVALYWQAVGIKVNIVPVDWNSLRAASTTGNATDYVWTHRGLSFPSPLTGLQAGFSPASVFASYANDQTGQWLERIGTELDPARRRMLIHDMGQFLRDEAAAVFIVIAHDPWASGPRIARWPFIRYQVTNIDQITLSDGRAP